MFISQIFCKIRRFDAYPKTLEDFRIKTFSGALVTIVSAVIMTTLFISELNEFLTPETTEELFVDISRGNKLRINVDVIFHRIPCASMARNGIRKVFEVLSIDAMDISGVQQINVEHNMYKRRLDLDGKPVQDPEKEKSLGDATKALATTKTTENGTKCGSCYGADSETGCCNTCEEIREAYRTKSWAFSDPDKYEQCRLEGWSAKLKEQQNEGCHVYGYLDVNRVAGNFHIAPGRSYQLHHIHVHDLQPYATSEFNVTHTIRNVAFGEHKLMKKGPLDDSYNLAEEGGMMFQYYVKIVPTMYVRKDKHVFETNQYSVTRHKKVASLLSGEQGMPGVFLIYELSPLMVKYTEKQKSFMHFLTGVCAIIGGVFTVAGLIDALIYHSSRLIQQKIELGKAN